MSLSQRLRLLAAGLFSGVVVGLVGGAVLGAAIGVALGAYWSVGDADSTALWHAFRGVLWFVLGAYGGASHGLLTGAAAGAAIGLLAPYDAPKGNWRRLGVAAVGAPLTLQAVSEWSPTHPLASDELAVAAAMAVLWSALIGALALAVYAFVYRRAGALTQDTD